MFKAILKSVVLVAVACGSTALAAPIEKIQLQRTRCFGPCPVYTLTIQNDGSVAFEGKDHVLHKGTATSTITAADWEFLVAALQRADFSALKDHYSTKDDGCTTVWTDSPALAITVTRGSEQKRVWYYLGCRGPEALDAMVWLGHTIDLVTNTRQWVGQE